MHYVESTNQDGTHNAEYIGQDFKTADVAFDSAVAENKTVSWYWNHPACSDQQVLGMYRGAIVLN